MKKGQSFRVQTGFRVIAFNYRVGKRTGLSEVLFMLRWERETNPRNGPSQANILSERNFGKPTDTFVTCYTVKRLLGGTHGQNCRGNYDLVMRKRCCP